MEEALGGLLRPCIESRHAYQALKSLATHKTDRNDARGFTAALGIPTLDGLGADGKGAHAAYEQIYFSSHLAATFDRYAITSDRIIRELAKIGFANIGDFIAVEEGGGAIVDFGTATREQMASLKSIEIDERMIDGPAAGVRKIKISLSDKRQALMGLAKIARILPADGHEHSGPGRGPIAFDVGVKAEHKIDIESLSHEQLDLLREL
jgi:hypothetical protein